MGWLERHFVEFPRHLLLLGVSRICRWWVSGRHFSVSRGRDEQCPTETLLSPTPGIILRSGRLFQLRFHCFSLAGQLLSWQLYSSTSSMGLPTRATSALRWLRLNALTWLTTSELEAHRSSYSSLRCCRLRDTVSSFEELWLLFPEAAITSAPEVMAQSIRTYSFSCAISFERASTLSYIYFSLLYYVI